MVPIIGDSELIVADSSLTPICTKLGSSLPGGSNSPGTRVVDSVPMKSAMERHDSELVAIDAASASEGAVLLDAYVHRKVEEAGDTAVDGGNQRVKISVQCAFRTSSPKCLQTSIAAYSCSGEWSTTI
jgi:hypothetical protein